MTAVPFTHRQMMSDTLGASRSMPEASLGEAPTATGTTLPSPQWDDFEPTATLERDDDDEPTCVASSAEAVFAERPRAKVDEPDDEPTRVHSRVLSAPHVAAPRRFDPPAGMPARVSPAMLSALAASPVLRGAVALSTDTTLLLPGRSIHDLRAMVQEAVAAGEPDVERASVSWIGLVAPPGPRLEADDMIVPFPLAANDASPSRRPRSLGFALHLMVFLRALAFFILSATTAGMRWLVDRSSGEWSRARQRARALPLFELPKKEPGSPRE